MLLSNLDHVVCEYRHPKEERNMISGTTENFKKNEDLSKIDVYVVVVGVADGSRHKSVE